MPIDFNPNVPPNNNIVFQRPTMQSFLSQKQEADTFVKTINPDDKISNNPEIKITKHSFGTIQKTNLSHTGFYYYFYRNR